MALAPGINVLNPSAFQHTAWAFLNKDGRSLRDLIFADNLSFEDPPFEGDWLAGMIAQSTRPVGDATVMSFHLTSTVASSSFRESSGGALNLFRHAW